MTEKHPLEGRVAIVTGSGRGIGRAIVNRLAASGAHVIINGIDEVSAQEAKVAIQQAGGQAVVVLGSVTDRSTADAMVKAAWDHWGRLDILVNNASVTRDSMIHLMSDEWFAMTMDVIVKGTFQCIRAATPLMRDAAEAELTAGRRVHRKIVNIASVAGIYGAVGKTGYAAANAAVIGMTKAVAKECAPFLVNCNAVAPGIIGQCEEATNPENIVIADDKAQVPTQPDTQREFFVVDDQSQVSTQPDSRLEFFRPEFEPWVPGFYPSKEQTTPAAAEIVDKFAQRMPMGRIGSPDDVAGAVAFLVGPDSDFITGTVLEIHGGMEFMNLG